MWVLQSLPSSTVLNITVETQYGVMGECVSQTDLITEKVRGVSRDAYAGRRGNAADAASATSMDMAPLCRRRVMAFTHPPPRRFHPQCAIAFFTSVNLENARENHHALPRSEMTHVWRARI